MTTKEAIYLLIHVHGIGPILLNRLSEEAGSYVALAELEKDAFGRLPGVTVSLKNAFQRMKEKQGFLLEQLAGLPERGIRFVTLEEEAYPKRLLPYADRPSGLYIKGKLPDENRPTAAIIGARACSDYGRKVAGQLSAALAREGVQIISGMALGIDGAGHEGALDQDRDTYAVLGCGITTCYPKEHFSMYLKIPERGGILSDCNLEEGPIPGNFPRRNRIISGLADAVIVVEAREKSGSLITAGLALEQGKEIFAVPGRITDSLSRGSNRLLKDGASLLTSPEDVLQYLYPERNRKEDPDPGPQDNAQISFFSEEEETVYRQLQEDPLHLDVIVSRSGLSASVCMDLLMNLELRGLAESPTGCYYRRR